MFVIGVSYFVELEIIETEQISLEMSSWSI